MKKEKIAILLADNSIIELRNKSEKDSRFEVDGEELYKYLGKIKAFIHTHKGTCEPSIIDVIYMLQWDFPWIIVSNVCIKGYIISDFRILEIDINSLIPKELHNFLMKLLQ